MALTEAERKYLDELEKTLTEENPKLASKFSQPTRRLRPAHAVGGVVGFLVGLAALIAGMSSYWWISVVGFVIMLASVVVVMSGWSKMLGGSNSAKTKASETFMSRMEQRWQDRQEQ
jgi:hypothetical protein